MADISRTDFTRHPKGLEGDSSLLISQFTEAPRLSQSIALTILERASLTLAQNVLETLPTFLKRVTTCFERLIVVPSEDECRKQPILAVKILRDLEVYLPTDTEIRKSFASHLRVIESQSAIIYETRARMRTRDDYSALLVALDRNARTIAILAPQIKGSLGQLIVPTPILTLGYTPTVEPDSTSTEESIPAPFEVKDLLAALPEIEMREDRQDGSELKPSEVVQPRIKQEVTTRIENRDSADANEKPSGCLNAVILATRLAAVAAVTAIVTSSFNFWRAKEDPIGDLLKIAGQLLKFVADHPIEITLGLGALLFAAALGRAIKAFDAACDADPIKVQLPAPSKVVRLSDGKGTPSTGGGSPDLDGSTDRKLGRSPTVSEATIESSGQDSIDAIQEENEPEPDLSVASRLAVTGPQVILHDRRTLLDVFAWIDTLPAPISLTAHQLLIEEVTFSSSYDPESIPANQTEISILPGEPEINLAVPSGYVIRGMRMTSSSGEIISSAYPCSVECCLLGAAKIKVPDGVEKIDYTIERLTDLERWSKIYDLLCEQLPAQQFDTTACRDPGLEALRDLNCSPTEKALLAMKTIKGLDLIWCSDFFVANILHLCKDVLPETVLTFRMATCSPMAVAATSVMRAFGAPAITIGGYSLPLTAENRLNFEKAHEQACLITPEGPIPFDPTASARLVKINGLIIPPKERINILEKAKQLSGKELYSFLHDLRDELLLRAQEKNASSSLSSLGYLRFLGEQLLRRIKEGEGTEEKQPNSAPINNTIADRSIASVESALESALELTTYCTRIARRIRDNPDDPMPALVFIDKNPVVPEAQPLGIKFLPEKLQWLDSLKNRKRFLADLAIDLAKAALAVQTTSMSEKRDVATWLANKIDNISQLFEFRFLPNTSTQIPKSYLYQPEFFPTQQLIRIFNELTPLLSNEEFSTLTSCFFGRLKRLSEHEEFSANEISNSEVNQILGSIKREILARDLRLSPENAAFWIQNFARIPSKFNQSDADMQGSSFLRDLCAASSSGVFSIPEALAIGIPEFKRAACRYAAWSDIREEIEKLSLDLKVRFSKAMGRSILRYLDDGYRDLGRHIDYLAKIGIRPDLTEIREELFTRIAEFTAIFKDSPLCFNYPSDEHPASSFLLCCPSFETSHIGELFNALRKLATVCTGFDESDIISLWPKVDEAKLAATILSGFQITYRERDDDSREVLIVFRPPSLPRPLEFEATKSTVLKEEVVLNTLLKGFGAPESLIDRLRLLQVPADQEPIITLLDHTLRMCSEQLLPLKAKFTHLSEKLKIDLVLDTIDEILCEIQSPDLLRAMYTINCSRGRRVLRGGLVNFDYTAITSPPENLPMGTDIFGKPVLKRVAFAAFLMLELALSSDGYGYLIVDNYLRNKRNIHIPLLSPLRQGFSSSAKKYWSELLSTIGAKKTSSLSRSQFAKIVEDGKKNFTQLGRRYSNPYQTFQIHFFGHVIVPSELGDLRELRDYTESDKVSAIDWRSSARSNRLIVRDFDEQEVRNLHLIYDAELLAKELSSESSSSRDQDLPYFRNLILHLLLAQRSGMAAKLSVISRGWVKEIEMLRPGGSRESQPFLDWNIWRVLARNLFEVRELSQKEIAVSDEPLGYNILSENIPSIEHSDISVFALTPHNARRASGVVHDLRRRGYMVEILGTNRVKSRRLKTAPSQRTTPDFRI